MYSSVMDHMRARKGITQARRQEQQMRTLQQLRDNQRSDAFLRQMPRRWAAGDVYAPHDLSPQEARKYRKAKAPRMDVMDALAINPVDEYRVCICVIYAVLPAAIGFNHPRLEGTGCT